jgi:predicted dehydrogenase
MKSRRQFFRNVAASAVASGFPTIVKASALGLNGAVAPSNRVTLATIGVGWMGGEHLNEFLKVPEAQYVAICDIDEEHLHAAKQQIDTTYGNHDCATYRAFEEVLSRKDIDAVSIAVPDHWHGIISVLALRAGKDVYGEKPLAYCFGEGAAIREAMRRYGRVWQTGSWQRSQESFRSACELVRNGRIGKVTRVEVGLPSGHKDFAKTGDQTEITQPPATLNWDRWLGPAPEAPYCAARVHKNWRWNLAYGGGQLMDWVGHHVDIAHWGLGFDQTGPYEVEGRGEYPPRDAVWNTATKYRVTARYAGGVTMEIAGGYEEIRSGTRWIGEEGWIQVDRGKLEAEPAGLLKSEIKAGEIHLPKSPGHYLEFIQAVKSRGRTLTPADVAVRSATPGWLGQIAMLTERKIKWDPVREEILGDEEASRMLMRRMRAPYQL